MDTTKLYNSILESVAKELQRVLNEDIVISADMREDDPAIDDKLVIVLTDKLKAGPVKFSFRKKENNKLRRARGTCHYDTIKLEYPDFDEVWEEDYEPRQTSNPKLVRFYDLDKRAWRSACMDNLLIILENKKSC